MKTKNNIFCTTFSLIVIMLFVSCGSKTSADKTNTIEQTENVMYQCPMKCEGEKMYDTPGACPVCSMDLEKVEGAHEHHDLDSTHTNH